jgi:Predicted membrane protein
VKFTESVKQFFSRYTDFRGRTPRSGYWWVVLFLVLGSFVMWALDMVLFQGMYPQDLLDQGLGPVSLLFIAATFIPNLALGFRRLHDTNRSAWWLLIGLVPFVGAVVLIVFYLLPSTPGDNNYRPQPLSSAGGDSV